MKGTPQRFGETAVQAGLLSPIDLTRALDEVDHRRSGGELVMLGEVLVRLGMMTPRQVVQILQKQGVRLFRHPHRRDRQYNVVRARHGRSYFCPVDGSRLVPVSPDEVTDDEASIGAIGIVHPDGTSTPARSGEHSLPRSGPTGKRRPTGRIGTGAHPVPVRPPAPRGSDPTNQNPRRVTRVPVPKMTPPAHLISNQMPEPTPARQVAPRGSLQQLRPGGSDSVPRRQVAPGGSLGVTRTRDPRTDQLPPVVARPTRRIKRSSPPSPPVQPAPTSLPPDDDSSMMEPMQPIAGALPGEVLGQADPTPPAAESYPSTLEMLDPSGGSDASFSTGAARLFPLAERDAMTRSELARAETEPMLTDAEVDAPSGPLFADPPSDSPTTHPEEGPPAPVSPPPDTEPALDVHPDQRFAWRELLANRHEEEAPADPMIRIPLDEPYTGPSESDTRVRDEAQMPTEVGVVPTDVKVAVPAELREDSSQREESQHEEPTEIGEVPVFVRDASHNLFGNADATISSLPSDSNPSTSTGAVRLSPNGSTAPEEESSMSRPSEAMVGGLLSPSDSGSASSGERSASTPVADPFPAEAESGDFAASDDDGVRWTHAISGGDGDLSSQMIGLGLSRDDSAATLHTPAGFDGSESLDSLDSADESSLPGPADGDDDADDPFDTNGEEALDTDTDPAPTAEAEAALDEVADKPVGDDAEDASDEQESDQSSVDTTPMDIPDDPYFSDEARTQIENDDDQSSVQTEPMPIQPDPMAPVGATAAADTPGEATADEVVSVALESADGGPDATASSGTYALPTSGEPSNAMPEMRPWSAEEEDSESDTVPEDALITDISPPAPASINPASAAFSPAGTAFDAPPIEGWDPPVSPGVGREFIELEDPSGDAEDLDPEHSNISSGSDFDGDYVELGDESMAEIAAMTAGGAMPDQLFLEPAPASESRAGASSSASSSAASSSAASVASPAPVRPASANAERDASGALHDPFDIPDHAADDPFGAADLAATADPGLRNGDEPSDAVSQADQADVHAEDPQATVTPAEAAEIRGSIEALLPRLEGTDRTALLATLALLTRMDTGGPSASTSADKIEGW